MAKQPAPSLKKENPVIAPAENPTKEMFEVPMIHKEIFPVYPRIKAGEVVLALSKSPIFINFKISNIENAFLSFNEKEIYILVLNEIENRYYQLPSEEIDKLALNPTDEANLIIYNDVKDSILVEYSLIIRK